MKSSLKSAFCLFILFIIVSSTYGAHILGGHMSYEVLSVSENNSQVRVDIEMYRDVGIGAQFDSELRFGVYRKINDVDYEYLFQRNTVRKDVISINAEVLPDCGFSVNSTERGFYSEELSLPNDGHDYIIVYQRCCRNSTLINIDDPGETGIAMHIIITSAGLQTVNTSHKLTNPMDRYLSVNTTNQIDVSLDETTDQYLTEFVIPFTAGGTDGTGTSEGDPNSCTGVTPDPLICPPPYSRVLLQPLISEMSLFYSDDLFEKKSELEYEITPNITGEYLVAYYIHEYRDSVLLSSHYVEQVYVVTNCDVTLDNKETELLSSINLYPNPVIDIIHIDDTSNSIYQSIQILDVNGNEVLSIKSEPINSIEVEGLSSGLYFLKLNSGAKIDILKFIKS